MQRVFDLVSSTYIGRAAHKIVSPLVRLARRISNPDIPSDHTVTRVSYRGRTFNLVHRPLEQSRRPRHPAVLH